VILFLNGPFGVGKSTAAELIVERILRAAVYDPEIVGAFVWHLTRDMDADVEGRNDFQDHPLWEPMVVETARLLKREYGRMLIIPMTVWRRDRFLRLTDGLREVDPELLRLLRLTASEDTLRGRILGRPESEGDHGWCLGRLGVCLEASRDPAFGVEIRTENRSPSEVADEILNEIGVAQQTSSRGSGS